MAEGLYLLYGLDAPRLYRAHLGHEQLTASVYMLREVRYKAPSGEYFTALLGSNGNAVSDRVSQQLTRWIVVEYDAWLNGVYPAIPCPNYYTN